MIVEVGRIVTLDDTDKYYLSDETEQNGKTYFLGLKVDENDDPSDESLIFEKEIDGEDVYLTEVEDEDIKNYLSAVFITKMNKVLDDLEENA